jgi:hypothetical protein
MNIEITQRYVLGAIGLLIIGGLLYTGSLSAEAAIMGILGILAALGAWEAPGRRDLE